jgi:hypothetical protein
MMFKFGGFDGAQVLSPAFMTVHPSINPNPLCWLRRLFEWIVIIVWDKVILQ